MAEQNEQNVPGPPAQPQLSSDNDEAEHVDERIEPCFTKRRTFYVNGVWRKPDLHPKVVCMSGQMYVESLEPAKVTQKYPIILIHGDFHTGQIWIDTPDGRPGWASFFAGHGYHVYVVDLPTCGRSALQKGDTLVPDGTGGKEGLMAPGAVFRLMVNPERSPPQHTWEKAKLHTQWAPTLSSMDQSFQNYCSSMVPLRLDKYQRQTMAQEALQALLEVTGKAILLGQGSGATMAWLATDVAHEQVAAVVAVEASGPPFGLVIGNDRRLEGAARYKEYTRYDPKIRRWGLADIPLTYHPPLPAPNDLSNKDDFDEKPLFDLEVKRWAEDDRKASVFQQVSSLIKGDARCHTLHNLRKVPHAFVTAEASFHTSYDWATVKFMRDAQVAVDWIRLERHGIRGNGHLMFLEKNSDQVASLIHYWIMRQMGSSSAVFHC